MDCGRCGSHLESPHLDGLFYEDQDVVCPGCGTTNQIGVDEESDADDCTAYVSHWTCKHGQDDATPCAECDAEDEAA